MISDEELELWINLYNKPKWNVTDRREMPSFSKLSLATDLLATRKEVAELTEKLREWVNFHPRAIKLMNKRKGFIVVACDELYYPKVYKIIKDSEIAKGRWSPVDERIYLEAVSESVVRIKKESEAE